MKTAICDVMLECYERGWITTRDGNASLRHVNSKFVTVTPSGIRKNTIRVEDLIKMTIVEGNLVMPEGVLTKPSGELHMHWRLLEHATKDRAVLHVHPTHTVAAMYAGWDLSLLAEQFPELGRYTKVARNIPVLPVTSKELGEATYEALAGGVFDIVGQDRHGICAIACDPWSAFEHVERLEHICEIVLKSGIKPS